MVTKEHWKQKQIKFIVRHSQTVGWSYFVKDLLNFGVIENPEIRFKNV